MTERRADDPRITQMASDIASLKTEMVSNTEITAQVRDLLASFRVMAAIAKWVTAIAAAGAALLALVKAWR